MQRAIDMVKEFQAKFETSDDPALWTRLILEERAEVEKAAAEFLKELADLLYVAHGYLAVIGECPEMPAFPPWMAAIMSFLEDECDILNETFKRVHESNMSKLGDDGQPVRREDGKILKGPNYKPPTLLDLCVVGST